MNHTAQDEIDAMRERRHRAVNRYREERRPHPLTVIGAIAVIGSIAFAVAAILTSIL